MIYLIFKNPGSHEFCEIWWNMCAIHEQKTMNYWSLKGFWANFSENLWELD